MMCPGLPRPAAPLLIGLFALCPLARAWGAAPALAPAAKADFNRDIRPILSHHCYPCHGPDETARKGNLRLDDRASATKPTPSGTVALVPGKLEDSELVKRILHADEARRMPPASTRNPLSEAQIETLTRWVAQGAEYKLHWAFLPPQRPAPPVVKNAGWPRNAVDAFILARLETHGLTPSPEADRRTLIRRLALDLTGLPPTPAEVEEFLRDPRPDAYERLVDRLLASPHYGERMTMEWLDAARVADPHGHAGDAGHDVATWLEGVIAAFNRNQRFDQFTLEQLAGDLLPSATAGQRVASGFNRSPLIRFESGAIPEESHAACVADRVNIATRLWLGLTVACARCHNHKYDPISTRDYYQLFACFNTVNEPGLDGMKRDAPRVPPAPVMDPAAKLAALDARVTAAGKLLRDREAALPQAQAAWEAAFAANPPPAPPGLRARFGFDETLAGEDGAGAVLAAEPRGAETTVFIQRPLGKALQLDGQSGVVAGQTSFEFDRASAFSYGAWIKLSGQEGGILSQMEAGQLRGFDLYATGDRLLANFIHAWPDDMLRVRTRDTVPQDRWLHAMVTYDGSGKAAGVKLYLDGVAAELETLDDRLKESFATTAPFRVGSRFDAAHWKGAVADVRVYDRALDAGEVLALVAQPARALALLPDARRTDLQRDELRQFFRAHLAVEHRQAARELADARKARDDFQDQPAPTTVLAGMEKPRDTFILLRGQNDPRGEQVRPALPALFAKTVREQPTNRLGLARWLVSPDNPLTARVIVNRYWQMYFGTGLVKTAEDFGALGEWPSHPELLDWLASEFVRRGWDVKAMQRLLVTSATYRQASVVTPVLIEKDPENRLLARGPRVRLQPQVVRDFALSVSGLLNPQIGGERAASSQPAGLLETLISNPERASQITNSLRPVAPALQPARNAPARKPAPPGVGSGRELMARENGQDWPAQTHAQHQSADLYRRTLYTFWKRPDPPPPPVTAEASDPDICPARRPQPDAPPDALITFNDPAYVEAGRKLAERLLVEAPSDAARIELAYQLALSRLPTKEEQDVLLKLLQSQLAACQQDRNTALVILGVGETPLALPFDAALLAAWATVVSVILNLDEALTKG